MNLDVQMVYDVCKDEVSLHGFEVAGVDAGWRANVDAFCVEITKTGMPHPLYHTLAFTHTELTQCTNVIMLRELLRDKLREVRKLRAKLGCTS